MSFFFSFRMVAAHCHCAHFIDNFCKCLQFSWCSWTLCMVCAGIASFSIFPTDPYLLKTSWFWCANKPKSHKQKCFIFTKYFWNLEFFQMLYFDLARFMWTKSREQYIVLPKAKHISPTNACCLKCVGFQFHRQELQKWVVVFGCKLCLGMFSYVWNCGWNVWNVSTVSLDSLLITQ